MPRDAGSMKSVSADMMKKTLKSMGSEKLDGETFEKKWKSFYSGIEAGSSGGEFKKELYKRLENQGFRIAPDLSEDEWAIVVRGLNYGPLMHLVASKMSSNKRKELFPEIAHKYEEAGAVAGPAPGPPAAAPSAPTAPALVPSTPASPHDHCSGLRNNGTAPYAVPLGMMAPGWVPYMNSLAMTSRGYGSGAKKKRRKKKAH